MKETKRITKMFLVCVEVTADSAKEAEEDLLSYMKFENTQKILFNNSELKFVCAAPKEKV